MRGGGQCIYLTETSYFKELVFFKATETEDDSSIHRETSVQGTHFGIICIFPNVLLTLLIIMCNLKVKNFYDREGKAVP